MKFLLHTIYKGQNLHTIPYVLFKLFPIKYWQEDYSKQLNVRQFFNASVNHTTPFKGVSGSEKIDETESPNRKCIRPCLVRFKTEPNRSKPIFFGLVLGFSFWDPRNRWTKPMLTSISILLLLSLLTHTYDYAQIQAQHKILNPFNFSYHHLISSLKLYFISTKIGNIDVNHTYDLAKRSSSPLR